MTFPKSQTQSLEGCKLWRAFNSDKPGYRAKGRLEASGAHESPKALPRKTLDTVPINRTMEQFFWHP